MLSVVIAQITSEMGLVSVEGSETIEWGSLVTSSPAALLKIINSKRGQHRQQQGVSTEGSQQFAQDSSITKDAGVADHLRNIQVVESAYTPKNE